MSVFSINAQGAPSVALSEIKDGAFDYNEPIHVETSQRSFNDFWVQPVGGVTAHNTGPYTFIINKMPDRYMQLNRAGLLARYRVTGPNGEVTNWDREAVAPINMLGVGMWKDVHVSLNDKPLPGSAASFAGLKAVLEAKISYDSDSANTHLRTQFYYRDSASQYDNMQISRKTFLNKYCQEMVDGNREEPAEVLTGDWYPLVNPLGPNTGPRERTAHQRMLDINSVRLGNGIVSRVAIEATALHHPEQAMTMRRCRAYQQQFNELYGYFMDGFQEIDVNEGFQERFLITTGSKEFDTYSPIPHDFFKLNNNIGLNNKVQLTLTRNTDAYCLNTYMDKIGYKLEVLDLRLHVHCIQRSEAIVCPRIELYMMNETQLMTTPMTGKGKHFRCRVHHGGVRPKTVLASFASVRGLDGSYSQNPHAFHHYNVSRITLQLDSEQYPSGAGLEYDFTKPNALASRGYQWVFENTGSWDDSRGNIITWESFRGGSFVAPFDLTPDKCNGMHNHRGSVGSVDIDIHFDVDLPEAVYLVYELVYPKVIVNDKEKAQVYILDVA